MQHNRLNLLLGASGFCFLLLYLTVAYFQRPVHDDYYFIQNLETYGVAGAAKNVYEVWTSRWTSIFLNNIILYFYKLHPATLFIFDLLNVIAFISLVYLFLGNLLNYIDATNSQTAENNNALFTTTIFHPEHLKSSGRARLLVSIYFTGLVFIFTPGIGETWFWLCSTCTYVWSAMALLAGVSWLIGQSSKPGTAITGMLGFLYLGGALGPLALVVILVLLIYIFYTLLFAKPRQTSILRPVYAILICFAAFLPLYLGKGSHAREMYFESIGVGAAFLLNFKMTAIILGRRILPYFPLLALLCLPVLTAGQGFTGKGERNKLIRRLLQMTIVYILLVFFYQLSITYKTQDAAADRTLFPLVLLTVAYGVAGSFLTGKYLLNRRITRRWTIFTLIFSCIMFTALTIRQQYLLRPYAKALDARIQYLKKSDFQEFPLIVKPLPSSGMLYSSEISVDTAHYTNRLLKLGLDLKQTPQLAE